MVKEKPEAEKVEVEKAAGFVSETAILAQELKRIREARKNLADELGLNAKALQVIYNQLNKVPAGGDDKWPSWADFDPTNQGNLNIVTALCEKVVGDLEKAIDVTKLASILHTKQGRLSFRIAAARALGRLGAKHIIAHALSVEENQQLSELWSVLQDLAKSFATPDSTIVAAAPTKLDESTAEIIEAATATPDLSDLSASSVVVGAADAAPAPPDPQVDSQIDAPVAPDSTTAVAAPPNPQIDAKTQIEQIEKLAQRRSAYSRSLGVDDSLVRSYYVSFMQGASEGKYPYWGEFDPESEDHAATKKEFEAYLIKSLKSDGNRDVLRDIARDCKDEIVARSALDDLADLRQWGYIATIAQYFATTVSEAVAMYALDILIKNGCHDQLGSVAGYASQPAIKAKATQALEQLVSPSENAVEANVSRGLRVLAKSLDLKGEDGLADLRGLLPILKREEKDGNLTISVDKDRLVIFATNGRITGLESRAIMALPEGLILPAGLINFSFYFLTSWPEGLTLPASLKKLSLGGFQSWPEGLALPNDLTELYFHKLKSWPGGLALPTGLILLNLYSLQSWPEGLLVPQSLEHIFIAGKGYYTKVNFHLISGFPISEAKPAESSVPIEYGKLLDKVEIASLQVGDFIHVFTSSGSRYVFRVIETPAGEAGFWATYVTGPEKLLRAHGRLASSSQNQDRFAQLALGQSLYVGELHTSHLKKIVVSKNNVVNQELFGQPSGDLLEDGGGDGSSPNFTGKGPEVDSVPSVIRFDSANFHITGEETKSILIAGKHVGSITFSKEAGSDWSFGLGHFDIVDTDGSKVARFTFTNTAGASGNTSSFGNSENGGSTILIEGIMKGKRTHTSQILYLKIGGKTVAFTISLESTETCEELSAVVFDFNPAVDVASPQELSQPTVETELEKEKERLQRLIDVGNHRGALFEVLKSEESAHELVVYVLREVLVRFVPNLTGFDGDRLLACSSTEIREMARLVLNIMDNSNGAVDNNQRRRIEDLGFMIADVCRFSQSRPTEAEFDLVLNEFLSNICGRRVQVDFIKNKRSGSLWTSVKNLAKQVGVGKGVSLRELTDIRVTFDDERTQEEQKALTRATPAHSIPRPKPQSKPRIVVTAPAEPPAPQVGGQDEVAAGVVAGSPAPVVVQTETLMAAPVITEYITVANEFFDRLTTESLNRSEAFRRFAEYIQSIRTDAREIGASEIDYHRQQISRMIQRMVGTEGCLRSMADFVQQENVGKIPLPRGVPANFVELQGFVESSYRKDQMRSFSAEELMGLIEYYAISLRENRSSLTSKTDRAERAAEVAQKMKIHREKIKLIALALLMKDVE